MTGLCLAGSILIALSPAFAQSPAIFQGPGIPLPPAQDQPWTPPSTKLSPATVNAITELFKDGMADPRGCDYREIEVITGQKPRTGAGVKTHGWVMPTKSDQTFAVCWNGLVYPVISVGAPVDLDQDAAPMLKNDQDEIEAERQMQAFSFSAKFLHWWRTNNAVSASRPSFLSCK